MKTVLIPCPKCAQPGTYLKGLSHSSSVDYYRCDDCGHVFTTRKSTTDLLDHVTFDPLRASCPPYLRVKPERRRAT